MSQPSSALGSAVFITLLWAAGALAASNAADLTKADHELKIAIDRAERSLGEHQPGSGHTKLHMQQVLNVLEGQGGKHFSAKVDELGDGTGVLPHLNLAEEKASPDAKAAIAHAKTFIQEAIEHAHRSVRAGSIEETHHHAALAAGLLQAAAGRERSKSPVTGALAYALMREES